MDTTNILLHPRYIMAHPEKLTNSPYSSMHRTSRRENSTLRSPSKSLEESEADILTWNNTWVAIPRMRYEERRDARYYRWHIDRIAPR